MSFMTYQARDILALPLSEMWKKENHHVVIQFDDGEISSSWRATIISRYAWWPHLLYPDIPLLKEHHLGNNRVFKSTFADLSSKILKQVLKYHRDDLDKELIMRTISREMNRVYNDFTYHLPEYITSINILDLAEVMYSKELFELNENAQPNHHSITQTHDKIRALIKTDSFLPKNAVLNEIRSGLVNLQQSLQVMSIRGYVTDIDGLQFPIPIMRGFAHGIHSMTELAQESRSASKALYYQTDPLQETEYFNRRLQLLTEPIRHLIKGNCGTTELIPWYVEGRDIRALVGIPYLDEETGQLTPIEDSKEMRKKIIDKKIQIRVPFLCRHLPRNGICEKCYGELRHSLPDQTNPGHFAAIEVGGTISQATLSVKHNDYSIEVTQSELDDVAKLYVEYTGTDGNQVKFLDKLMKGTKKIEIHLKSAEVKHLNDVDYFDNLEELSPSNLTAIQDIDITITKADDNVIIDYITLANKSRKAYFTYDFLHHVKRVGFSPSGSKTICIDITDWDFTKPVFELPLRRESMLDFMKNFASNIETQYGKANLDIRSPSVLGKTLFNIYDISNNYVNLHLTHLSTLLAAIMVRDSQNKDYRLPIRKDQREFVSADVAIQNRSITTTMAYEEQHVVFTDPNSYLIKVRVSHPFDNILFPSIGNIYRDYQSWADRKEKVYQEIQSHQVK